MVKDTRTPIQREDDMHASLLAALAQIAKNTSYIARHAGAVGFLNVGDAERVMPAPAPTVTPAAQKVEIAHDGGRRLLFIDGKRIDKVLTIETPRDKDSIAGMVKVSFVASEIVEREVSREQFAALLRGG